VTSTGATGEPGWSATDPLELRRLGMRVRLKRVGLDESQRGLAERAGIDRVKLASIERGECAPGAGALARLAAALGVPVAELTSDVGWDRALAAAVNRLPPAGTQPQPRRPTQDMGAPAGWQLGRRLRLFRLAREQSQVELGRRVGIPAGQVGEIERGVREPDADLLDQLAAALDIPTVRLTSDDRWDQILAGPPTPAA
jgi:transcriptional regulator with XRE-family HTH domain